jgi:hypothetical protein
MLMEQRFAGSAPPTAPGKRCRRRQNFPHGFALVTRAC